MFYRHPLLCNSSRCYSFILVNDQFDAGLPDSHPLECVIPDGVLIQVGPPDDEHLLLETCRGVEINTLRKSASSWALTRITSRCMVNKIEKVIHFGRLMICTVRGSPQYLFLPSSSVSSTPVLNFLYLIQIVISNKLEGHHSPVLGGLKQNLPADEMGYGPYKALIKKHLTKNYEKVVLCVILKD